jgi:hypothetical protein
MDALHSTILAPRTALNSSNRSTRSDEHDLCLAPRVREGISALLEALDYADDLRLTAWDFAVEISALRGLELSNSDLRWLVGKGLVEYAVETTMSGEFERTFRPPTRPLFSRRGAFVLTAAGAEFARALRTGVDSQPRLHSRSAFAPSVFADAGPERPLPKWDRDRQELRLGAKIVKQFKVPAANQEAILAAFEEESWPPRIDDPLPPHGEQSPKRRLQETIKSLNRNQKRPLLRFLGDGSGQGVRWEMGAREDAERGD